MLAIRNEESFELEGRDSGQIDESMAISPNFGPMFVRLSAPGSRQRRSREELMSRLMRHLCLFLFSTLLGSCAALGEKADDERWQNLGHIAPELAHPLEDRSEWESRDVGYLQSAASPGAIIRMRSQWIQFFSGLAERGGEGPSFFVVMTPNGAKSIPRGSKVAGRDLQASWILVSFQDSKGWELFDTPWFLSLEKKPTEISLTRDGLRIEFPERDTGLVFSMPFYGYDKPPQQGNDFAVAHGLPSKNIKPWTWRDKVPDEVIARAEWWASVAKAFPVGFQESFSIDLRTDEITFRQDYRWLTVEDAWKTKPVRFATLSPTLGLAWKIPGFPMEISVPIHDPDYFTAFGPFVGALEVDRVEVKMAVLQYTNELEQLTPPKEFDSAQMEALGLIVRGMKEKFQSGGSYVFDHPGEGNLCWNVVGDVWYGRGLAFVDFDLKRRATQSMAGYMDRNVLQPHTPYHGKYVIEGRGISSGGHWGDAGKFMANSLQTIWAFGQFSGDWALIRDRWDLIQRFFITPEETFWTTFGRVAIAEMGDEAPSSSSYARLAWQVRDYDEYLFGAYMFARQLVHHYVKQRGGEYFLAHQPHNVYGAMASEVFPTHVSQSTMGWNVDGPAWGYQDVPQHDHQSTNRWVRFHDPDVGRFYRDHLREDVRRELDWYADAVRTKRSDVHRFEVYENWFRRDSPHIFPSLARLRSFLLGESYEDLQKAVDMSNYQARRSSAVALGYSFLRSMVPVTHVRLVDGDAPPSPYVIGLQRRGFEDVLTATQFLQAEGLVLEPIWRGWGFGTSERGARSRENRTFGAIEGDFAGKVAGFEQARWISYGSLMYSADAIAPRNLRNVSAILREQDQTPVAVIGPFSNESDSEIQTVRYPPELETNPTADYRGLEGKVTWRTTRFAPGRLVHLQREFSAGRGRMPDRIAYALQHVWAPEEMDVYLLAGDIGGVQAWIGEALVIDYHGRHRRQFTPDAQRGFGRLRQGWNRILVKVEAPAGAISSQFRLVHLDRQPIPGLKFAAFPPDRLQ